MKGVYWNKQIITIDLGFVSKYVKLDLNLIFFLKSEVKAEGLSKFVCFKSLDLRI